MKEESKVEFNMGDGRKLERHIEMMSEEGGPEKVLTEILQEEVLKVLTPEQKDEIKRREENMFNFILLTKAEMFIDKIDKEEGPMWSESRDELANKMIEFAKIYHEIQIKDK